MVLLISIFGSVQAMDSKPGANEETEEIEGSRDGIYARVLSEDDFIHIRKKVSKAQEMEVILRVLYNRAINAKKKEEDVASILTTYKAINTMRAAEAALESAELVKVVAAKRGDAKAFTKGEEDFLNKGEAFRRALYYAKKAICIEEANLKRENSRTYTVYKPYK